MDKPPNRSNPRTVEVGLISTAGNVVAMAEALGPATVAEGIETERRATTLLSLGCDLAQGFDFGRPFET